MMDVRPFLVHPDMPVTEVVGVIDANRRGAAIVVDDEQHLIGVVTDGDVRRAILAGLDLQGPVSCLLARRRSDLYPVPIKAAVSSTTAQRTAVMQQHRIRHLPLVDEHDVVVGLAVFDDLLREAAPPVRAVVMAGGFGRRMRPLTDNVPKPMLPVDGKPLLERVIQGLHDAGITRMHVATHYKPEKIVEYFGNGERFGVQIEYLRELEPLGTAGALCKLDTWGETLLVINGDILTQVDFAAMHRFHRDHDAEMTVAVKEYTFRVPYGVVTVNGVGVTGIEEKPSVSYFVNAGIYLLEPSVASSMTPDGGHCDMTDLIARLLAARRQVVSFPVREYWLDVGGLDDYDRAQSDATTRRLK